MRDLLRVDAHDEAEPEGIEEPIQTRRQPEIEAVHSTHELTGPAVDLAREFLPTAPAFEPVLGLNFGQRFPAEPFDNKVQPAADGAAVDVLMASPLRRLQTDLTQHAGERGAREHRDVSWNVVVTHEPRRQAVKVGHEDDDGPARLQQPVHFTQRVPRIVDMFHDRPDGDDVEAGLFEGRAGDVPVEDIEAVGIRRPLRELDAGDLPSMLHAQVLHELAAEAADVEQTAPRVARHVAGHRAQPGIHVLQRLLRRFLGAVEIIVVVAMDIVFDGPRVHANEAAAPAPHDAELGDVGREAIVAAKKQFGDGRRRAQVARVVFPPNRVHGYRHCWDGSARDHCNSSAGIFLAQTANDRRYFGVKRAPSQREPCRTTGRASAIRQRPSAGCRRQAFSVMGIDSTLAYFLGRTAQRFGAGGRLCTLGVQNVRASRDQLHVVLTAAGLPPTSDAADLYSRLGFSSVESVDVSDFEGCTHIVDLNAPGVAEHLRGRFDVVYNGGTLEHVFDVRAAFRNIFELLKVGGLAIHAVPSSGWVDHGFYQFSPTLLADYYGANGFDILEAILLEPAEGPQAYVAHTYVPDAPGGANIGTFAGRWLTYVTVRKRNDSSWDVVPRQSYYQSLHSGATTPALDIAYRPPFRIENGVPVPFAALRHALPTPQHGAGLEWIIRLPHLRSLADGAEGGSSPLLLFEDGEPIGPPHALHADIRARGRGRYSHWDEAVHFAPSRNDDAREHVYTYALRDCAAAGHDGRSVHTRGNVGRPVRWSV